VEFQHCCISYSGRKCSYLVFRAPEPVSELKKSSTLETRISPRRITTRPEKSEYHQYNTIIVLPCLIKILPIPASNLGNGFFVTRRLAAIIDRFQKATCVPKRPTQFLMIVVRHRGLSRNDKLHI